MEIRMARGDYMTQTFTVTENGEPPAEAFDNIYFTVKKKPDDKVPLIQKMLSDGTIFETETTGTYQFTIEPEDTDGLPFGQYGFDIEFFREGTLKRTFCGVLMLTEEYTHHCNEVEGD